VIAGLGLSTMSWIVQLFYLPY